MDKIKEIEDLFSTIGLNPRVSNGMQIIGTFIGSYTNKLPDFVLIYFIEESSISGRVCSLTYQTGDFVCDKLVVSSTKSIINILAASLSLKKYLPHIYQEVLKLNPEPL